MSDGKTHDNLTRYSAFPVALSIGICFYVFTRDFYYSLKCSIFSYSGIQIQRLFTPDLDIDNDTFSNYLIGLFDPYLEKIYTIFFYLYRKMIPHRSFISHGIIIGTLSKFIYCFILLFPLWMFTWYRIFIYYIPYYYDYFLVFILSFILADLGHLYLDKK